MTIAVRIFALCLAVLACVAALSSIFSIADPYDTISRRWLVFTALLVFGALSLLAATGQLETRGQRRQMIYSASIMGCATPLVVALPFLFTGTASSISAAIFEGIAAVTTTGSSGLNPPSTLPDAVVVWRVMTEWLGGWLFLVFVFSIQPSINIAGMSYATNLLPHGEGQSFYERLTSHGAILGRLYAAITGLGTLALLLAGEDVLPAIALSMTAIATGGYLPMEAGLSAFGNSPRLFLYIFLLLLGCLNFTLHYQAIRGRPDYYLKDIETRTFARMLVLGTFTVLPVLIVFWAFPQSVETDWGVGDILFITLSSISTSGLSTAGTQVAPLYLGILVLSLSVAGGAAGSTTGGIKMLRAMLIDRFVNEELSRLSNPNRVRPVLLRKEVIRIGDMMGVWALVLAIAFSVALGSLVLSALQMPFLTAIVVSVSSVTNTGPLPHAIDASFAGYGVFSPAMYWTVSALMLLGKMEFLILLALIFRLFSRD